MAVTWITPAGDLGILEERNVVAVSVQALSDAPISYSVISGQLPAGLRLDNGIISGSPTEVTKFTTSKFVVRASAGGEIADRTFSLSVDGSDDPEFITPEGFLNVGAGDAYFVLDNARVNFQVEATDRDLIAGQELEYFVVPNSGELPPGLSLSKTGLISGFTDPIFSLKFNNDQTGSFDSNTYDTTPLDIAGDNINGYDTFIYDNETFDYNEPSQVPKRLSRIYTFAIGITDGLNVETRIFKIYVVTEEFLQADNNLLEVDTNLFQADASSNRYPLWITESNLGRYRANNYVYIDIDVYDPPTLTGTINIIFVAENPDGSPSELPPGMTLDTTTGDIAGIVPYQASVTKTYKFTLLAVNIPRDLPSSYTLVGDWRSNRVYTVDEAVRYDGKVYIALQPNKNRTPAENEFWTTGTTSVEKTFSIDIIGELESNIRWTTPSNIGTIKPNSPSRLFVAAESLTTSKAVKYEQIGGRIPPGLQFLTNGLITGKVKQFADSDGPGLTRIFENDGSSLLTQFDGNNTTFDRKFVFRVRAKDFSGLSELERTFNITVDDTDNTSYANLYVKCLQDKQKRLDYFDFITDSNIFRANELYRPGDTNYGLQNEIKMLLYAGIESKEAVDYIQAMSRNHYRKRLLFGNVKYAVAKDPGTQNPIYEVVYVEIVDELETSGESVSKEIELRDNINSKVLVSYDAITIDSDIPFVSDSDHQRVFPNSITNMRDRLENIGKSNREFLPLWMRSIQPDSATETGFVKALILCYTEPGNAEKIVSRINASTYDFKQIDFYADRYIIDIVDGEIEDKYLAFPQRGEKEP